jgi:ABC-2 type transport system permease protein
VSLALVHARATTRELARYPAYVVPTLVFPTAFFLVFAGSRGDVDANRVMAAFAGFAAIGVAFFQFGVGIATDRASPWETYLRTLPIGAGVRLGARVLSATLFAAAASATVVAVALATTDAALSPVAWTELALVLLAGIVPFALLGIALGYWLPPKGALPVANVLYLTLSYTGGLWTGPSGLPDAVRQVAPVLPTWQWGDVLWPAALGAPWPPTHWVVLGGYARAFGAAAVWGYRRDEGQRFR